MTSTNHAVSDHDLFETHEISNAKWDVHGSVLTIIDFDGSLDNDGYLDDATKEMMLEATRQEGLVSCELAWLRILQENCVLFSVYDQSAYTGTFVGELHAGLVDQILKIPNSNTVIVGPTAMTILQSAISDGKSLLERFPSPTQKPHSKFMKVGRLDGRLDVFLNVYISDQKSVFVGYVPEPGKRLTAVVPEGQTQFRLGIKDGVEKEWNKIDINAESITFW